MTEGYHEVTYDDGDRYKGEWNAGGKRHGYGVLYFSDGTVFAGQFANGMNTGNGSLTFPDKSKYEGQFADGKFSGFGVFSNASGMKYEGEFKDGKMEGCGRVTFEDGSSGRPRQEGTFKDAQLVTGGKQGAAIKQAQQAQEQGKAAADKANALEG
eukprot:m.341572 g.341572  ORF g.341572 m.341572 type:complete len:155 (+) comp19835_c2_seq1:390-854(+)